MTILTSNLKAILSADGMMLVTIDATLKEIINGIGVHVILDEIGEETVIEYFDQLDDD